MDKYVIERKIGQGSYGGVYIVHLKNKVNKRYVLKRIPLNTLSAKEKKAAEQEVALLQTLQHPNIVRYKDSFLDNRDRDLCIIMRHCEGGDLSSKIKQYGNKLIPEATIMKWFVQIALALEFIHNRKVLHRDLKTQNVFLTKEGHIKLGDFGIARVLNRTVDFAQTSIGTPLYMSPECCNNKPYSFKSDVWSLGCILYEMCSSGRHPFNARDLNGLFMKIIRGIYSPISSTYSTKMRDMISMTLSTNPQKRPTVSKLMKTYTSKYILEYLSEYEAEQNKNVNCNSSLDIERVELNNLRLQIQDLGLVQSVSPPVPLSARSRSENSVLQDQAEKAKALPLNSQMEKHGANNPALSFALNKNKAKIDVKKAEAKLNALERERQKYQLAIEKLREERNARAKRIAEKSNMLQEMRDQRRKRETELNLKADDKQNRIRLKEMNINQQKSDAVMQKVRADPKYRQDVENLKQVQAEKEKWQREVGRLQSQIDALQKKSEPSKGGIISNYPPSSNAILTPRPQPIVQAGSHNNSKLQKPPDQKPLTDKERVLLEKEKKRKEEEELYIKRLKEERIKVYQEKLNAQQLNALQYQPSFYQPPAQSLPAYQVPSSQRNPQKIEHRKYGFDNEKKEEDEEDYLLNELQDGLLHATKKIENLRKSIAAAQARGAMIEDDSESEYEELDEDNGEEELEEEDDRNDNVRIGRLADRAKFLRNQCNKVFGQDLFEKIYNHIRIINDRNMVHDENDQKRYKRLVSVLGLNNAKLVDYCHLIDELLFVEGTMS